MTSLNGSSSSISHKTFSIRDYGSEGSSELLKRTLALLSLSMNSENILNARYNSYVVLPTNV
jgi:hypothetical protein